MFMIVIRTKNDDKSKKNTVIFGTEGERTFIGFYIYLTLANAKRKSFGFKYTLSTLSVYKMPYYKLENTHYHKEITP